MAINRTKEAERLVRLAREQAQSFVDVCDYFFADDGDTPTEKMAALAGCVDYLKVYVQHIENAVKHGN